MANRTEVNPNARNICPPDDAAHAAPAAIVCNRPTKRYDTFSRGDRSEIVLLLTLFFNVIITDPRKSRSYGSARDDYGR